MVVLVCGGAASGKSGVAEDIASSLSEKRTYVATMRNDGPEAAERIERHRERRAHFGFDTVECPDTLAWLTVSDQFGGVALLDDLGNLCANALFAPDGSMRDVVEVRIRLEEELAAFTHAFEHVVAVVDEVGSEGASTSEEVTTWIQLVGSLSATFASISDAVVEVTSGIPTYVKGEPWWS